MKNLYLPLVLISVLSLDLSAISITAFAEKKGMIHVLKPTPRVSKNCFTENPENPTVIKSKKELKGDRYFFIYDYSKAIETYKDLKDLSTEGQRKLAKSYYYMNQSALSEKAYGKLISMEGGNRFQDYFDYAMVLKSVGKYEESSKWMDLFAEMAPNDLRAKDYLKHKSALDDLKKDDGKYKIVGLDINTDAQDFSPSYYKNKVVFASTRTTKMFPKNSYRNGKPYLNIYVADISNTQLVNPENFDKDLNGKMNDGPACFTKDGLFMAYTKNNYNLNKKELIVNVEIYFRSYVDGKWSEPEAFNANSKDYSVSQPCLSNRGNTMYFSSNMPGGYGGADIYSVSKSSNGTWNAPVNLGSSINTEGDEVFPFFEEGRDVLFYSSNGLFGLGGLDIFTSVMKGSDFSDAFNAGAPLNSVNDDFAIVMDSSIHKGYFSSNRVGGKGDDDLYMVEFLSLIKVNGVAKDLNNHLLAGTFITLVDRDGRVVDTITTKKDGQYEFQVLIMGNYSITGTKDAYSDGLTKLNASGSATNYTADVVLSQLVVTKIEIEPVKTPTVTKVPVKTKTTPIPLFRPIYFDYHEYALRPEAVSELDKIAKVLNENPEMRIELTSHTDCRSSKAYNQTLSNKRAKASADYLRKKISNPQRITAKGYGETQLKNNCECEGKVVSNCPEDEHQENRRTDFVISKGSLITN